MLLIPTKYQFSFISDAVRDDFIPTQPIHDAAHDNIFLERVHTALQIHSDLKAMSGHTSLDVSEEAAKKIVPESLYMLLSLIVGGQGSLDEMLESESSNTEEDIDDDDEDESDNVRMYHDGKYTHERKVLSIAQDIIYAASKGKKLTPKHIGLGLTVHQMTRSRKLVTLLNKAGHCLTYPKLLQIDNTLADLTLSTLDYTTGAVVPPHFQSAANVDESDSHLKPEPILQLTADNIDIIMNTLDGKKSFHATQIVAFQRGVSPLINILNQIQIRKTSSFRIPQILNQLPADPTLSTFSPIFKEPIKTSWYERNSDVPESLLDAKATDLSFLLSRQNQPEDNRVGWTQFNRENSRSDAAVTNQGFMPLILNPAHEYSTLELFLKRAISLADSLNYK